MQGAQILQDKVIVGARGTITPVGLDVSENTKHLLEKGFAYVHLAPANDMLNKKEVEELLSYYAQYCTDFETLLADKKYRECILRYNLYSILREIHERGIRNIYPCHRFVGNEDFNMENNCILELMDAGKVYGSGSTQVVVLKKLTFLYKRVNLFL